MHPKFPMPYHHQPLQAGKFTLQPQPMPLLLEVSGEGLDSEASHFMLSTEDKDFLKCLNTYW